MKEAITILFLAPLLGFLFNGFRFKSPNLKLSGLVGTVCALTSFIASLVIFYLYLSEGSQTVFFFNWLEVGSFKVPASFLVDSLSTILILVVTGVGSLIHLFSISYMDHDKRPSKYFAYLNFFLFNMLVLVLANNLALMFVGWEGVGLCSYLLIGFWFEDRAKSQAGLKAFITNRVGDLAFLIGIFLIYYLFSSLEYTNILNSLPSSASHFGLLSLACLALFVGATGKSAQIPLYVWLPDAMAGPTPVSALIHAATMVTAGIYMIARLGDLFLLAPLVMNLIAIIGALTALFAALIAVTQWDIKKILAYSTVSQLGYMFLALGVGAFSSAIFHLFTHAFFKALMFLGAGSIIYALSHEQDIRKMGGLKNKMPLVYRTFLFAYLALIGIFPFSGFFSKDEILWWTLESHLGGVFLYSIGFITAALTAFYMTRLMSYVFWSKNDNISPSKINWLMATPLVVLCFFSIFSGFLGFPHGLAKVIPIPHVLESYFANTVENVSISGSYLKEVIFMLLSLLLALSCAYLSYLRYVKNNSSITSFLDRFKPLHYAMENKFFVDEFYSRFLIKPLYNMSQVLFSHIEVSFVDRASYILSHFVVRCSNLLRASQTGQFQLYCFYIFCGSLIILVVSLLGAFL